MKTVYRLDGLRVAKKVLVDKLGAERVKRMTADAVATFRQDPLVQNDFWVGFGMLTIEFT